MCFLDQVLLLQDVLEPGVAAGATVLLIPVMKATDVPTFMTLTIEVDQGHDFINRGLPGRCLVEPFVDKAVKTVLPIG